MSLLKLYAQDRVALFFGVIFVAFYVVAVLAPWIVPGDPLETNLSEGLLPFVERILAASRRPRQNHLGPASRAQVLGTLSARETDILKLIAQGMSNKETARILDIGPETVKTHLKNVFTKLGVERRAQAVSRAQTLGLVTTD